MDLKNRIDIAAGRKKAGLVLKNCNVINVFTLEIIKTDVAIDGDTIVAVGTYSGEKEIELDGKYLAPGFIDGHVHIESSMVTPSRFAEAVMPCGTTTVIADPHEIVNVCGREGLKFMIEDSVHVPLDIHYMLPSCIPAVDFEEQGGEFDTEAIREFIGAEGVLGLGEVMCYPDIIAGKEGILEKIEVAQGRRVDGHAPWLTGTDLAAYVASGASTDHECAAIKEMREKQRLGMYVHIRQGSTSQEAGLLVKGINSRNMRHAVMCTDDRHAHDILMHGHINNAVKVAVKSGLDPAIAVTIATLNTALCYGLDKIGAIAPGYKADLVVLDNLKDFRVLSVYKNGEKVAENGKALFTGSSTAKSSVTGTVMLTPITEDMLAIKLSNPDSNGKRKVNVIVPKEGTLETSRTVCDVKVENGCFMYTEDSDINKIAVFERYGKSGNIGLGLCIGLGIRNGAVAQTISHDSHNVVAVGDNDRDIVLAVNALAKGNSGGVVLVHNGEVKNLLELPIAGLMSLDPLWDTGKFMGDIERNSYELLKVNKNFNVFMVLGFFALPVIPELRVTTKGLFDVLDFKFVSIEA
jgi:adenine deaminase